MIRMLVFFMIACLGINDIRDEPYTFIRPRVGWHTFLVCIITIHFKMDFKFSFFMVLALCVFTVSSQYAGQDCALQCEEAQSYDDCFQQCIG